MLKISEYVKDFFLNPYFQLFNKPKSINEVIDKNWSNWLITVDKIEMSVTAISTPGTIII